MSSISTIFDGDMEDLLGLTDTIEKMILPTHHHCRRRYHHHHHRRSTETSVSVPVDVLENPTSYVFVLDVPGLSKSEIQVTVEDEEILVVRTNGKRKRDNNTEEEKDCKYLLLERNAPPMFTRKFRLPEDSDTSAISARCEDGVLTVSVGKEAPPPKSKSVEVSVG